MSRPPALAALADRLRAQRQRDLQDLGWLPLAPEKGVDAAPLDAAGVGALMARIDAAWDAVPGVVAAWQAQPVADVEPSSLPVTLWSADGLADTLPSDPTRPPPTLR